MRLARRGQAGAARRPARCAQLAGAAPRGGRASGTRAQCRSKSRPGRPRSACTWRHTPRGSSRAPWRQSPGAAAEFVRHHAALTQRTERGSPRRQEAPGAAGAAQRAALAALARKGRRGRRAGRRRARRRPAADRGCGKAGSHRRGRPRVVRRVLRLVRRGAGNREAARRAARRSGARPARRDQLASTTRRQPRGRGRAARRAPAQRLLHLARSR